MDIGSKPKTNPEKMDFKTAWEAMKRLIEDPEDTVEVFTIIRAMSGPSLRNGFRKFRVTETGKHILNQEQDLLDVLKDREHLRAMPPDSLGRAYLQFVENEEISAEGLVEASENNVEIFADENITKYGKRLRDQHDLWHVLTGYGRDELGELCLLGFTYAQTKNRGIGLILLVGFYQFLRTVGTFSLRPIRRGWEDGRKAAWLPEMHWETILSQPLDELRERLKIKEPIAYKSALKRLATNQD